MLYVWVMGVRFPFFGRYVITKFEFSSDLLASGFFLLFLYDISLIVYGGGAGECAAQRWICYRAEQ